MSDLRFRASVPPLMQSLLRRLYADYIARLSMTADEREALCKWVSQGNYPYSNPWNLSDEKGQEMDFISGLRTTNEMVAEREAEQIQVLQR